MEFRNAYLLLIFTVICAVPSSAQNLELVDKIDKLELSVFGKNPCQNCMVEQQIKYFELVSMKISAMNLADQFVNWSNNFAFALASRIMSFSFNLTVAVLGICYTNRVNRKFKIWEESEELKF